MKLDKTLCWIAIGVAGLMAVLFAVDLATGLIFRRFSLVTEICVLLGCGLLIWQGVETLREL